MNHKHQWKPTGKARYTFPLQYEYCCSRCGKKKWVEGKEILPTLKRHKI